MHQDFSLEKVKKVGILWDASFENDFQHLAALNRQLSESGRSVEVMAWIPGKSVPDRLTGLTYMKFLRTTDLNWAFSRYRRMRKSSSRASMILSLT
ncbi:MAG: hypothetical protein MZV63_11290 [Marinilabiliales bacterium]|nr:hypothetical protein [Marinilabiliales bacterium]